MRGNSRMQACVTADCRGWLKHESKRQWQYSNTITREVVSPSGRQCWITLSVSRTKVKGQTQSSGEECRSKQAIAFPFLSKALSKVSSISSKGDVEQGFDIDIDGWLQLKGGERVERLRTWNDPRYAPVVEYPFWSKNGSLSTEFMV